jgi:hypothetical protein
MWGLPPLHPPDLIAKMQRIALHKKNMQLKAEQLQK